ncbi:hypothetical protein Gogos_022041 [Gossypium gossypioides]|uniref:Uncharacterized protein n=1 Tax=Gossypium gossypioides TaxID=34282 RepID=A0A7J9D3I5_GOSGO|nr:hypothetical protein [Gossypium gossypioides]
MMQFQIYLTGLTKRSCPSWQFWLKLLDFWKVEKVCYRVFSEDYSPLKEFVAIPRRDNISEEKWMTIL